MAADFLAGFERALGRPPITRPAVRTFAPRAWRPLARVAPNGGRASDDTQGALGIVGSALRRPTV